MKPKAKTNMERMGFVDHDLTTPRHDEIMKWLDNFIDTRIGDVLGISRHWTLTDLPSIIPPKPPVRVIQKIWEYPLEMNRGFIEGFADLFVFYEYPFIRDEKICFSRCKCMFEVKTEIPSLGDLFRQLSVYRRHMRESEHIIVVSPDSRFSTEIRAQKYLFLKYTSNNGLFEMGEVL